ncbi:MarR family winged helix-turn-helix transcriptional regulator [Ningiella sp. W23]|uniref:MarR family winged helix-turn-helix transcriptional regulator n=1 Tax=Ningiella sp. W23 TaxID=3023715 RepID=UPI0037572DD6
MSKQQETLLTLERYMPYRLSVLSNKVSSLVAQAYKDKFALSITEWRIMAVLGEYPGVSADEVSTKTQIEKSLISRAISNLLKRKLIMRSIAKEDKRRSELALSGTGYDVYSEIVPLSIEYERQFLSCLNHKEQLALDEIILRLDKHAQQLEF